MKLPKAHKLPSGSWNIYLRLGGEGISVTASTEKECRTKAQQIKAEYLAGERVPKAHETCKALAERYISDREAVLSPSTVYGYKKILLRYTALHGLRRSELLALDKGSVWGGVIYVRGAVVMGPDGFVEKPENKNTASRRTVPVLIPRLQELVDAAPDGKLYPYMPQTLYKAINRVCEASGLPCTGVHGLRHSFISLCYHAGLSPLQTMSLGGYSDMATMQRIYTHLSEADKKAGADKVKDFFAQNLG